VAKQVLTNVRYFLGIVDLTTQSNKVELDWSAEDKDTTNYGSNGKKERIAGLEDVAISAEGQEEHGSLGYIGDHWWNSSRLVEAHTIGSHTADVGAMAYITEAVKLAKKTLGAAGDVNGYTLTANGNAGLGIGQFAQSSGTPVTAAVDGTAIQLGALSASQRLIASLHVLSVAGTNTPELTMIVESDSVEAFSGSPETRLTFSTFTTTGSEVQRSAVGAHTDTWYRVSFDVEDNGGTGESFLVVAAIGIG